MDFMRWTCKCSERACDLGTTLSYPKPDYCPYDSTRKCNWKWDAIKDIAPDFLFRVGEEVYASERQCKGTIKSRRSFCGLKTYLLIDKKGELIGCSIEDELKRV